MVRADGVQTKVHFKGSEDDYIIIAENAELVKKWREDKTIPLIDVVNAFEVFTTHKYARSALAPMFSLARLTAVRVLVHYKLAKVSDISAAN